MTVGMGWGGGTTDLSSRPRTKDTSCSTTQSSKSTWSYTAYTSLNSYITLSLIRKPAQTSEPLLYTSQLPGLCLVVHPMDQNSLLCPHEIHIQWKKHICPGLIWKTIWKIKTVCRSPKFTSPTEMFYNENYLDEPQDTELKRTVIILIKEFTEFKEDTNQRLSKPKENEFKENAWLIPKEIQI